MSINARWRPAVAMVVVLATVAAFVDYLVHHPGLQQQLRHIPPLTLLLLIGLYVAFVGSLALINSAALRLCRSRITARESLLLTAYSSIINFFGPLQSGPAFRALYLKQRHGIKLKDYTLASFAYYFCYALFSGLLVLSGLLKWWLVPLLVIVLVGLASSMYDNRRRRWKWWLPVTKRFDPAGWAAMAGATLVQVSLLVIIFDVELRAVAPAVHLSQVLVYTGAANLALFVSLTPGAIGFRESFLLFSQHLHHINSSTILAANLIDRSVYILLLLLMAIVIFGTHLNRRLRPTPRT